MNPTQPKVTCQEFNKFLKGVERTKTLNVTHCPAGGESDIVPTTELFTTKLGNLIRERIPQVIIKICRAPQHAVAVQLPSNDATIAAAGFPVAASLSAGAVAEMKAYFTHAGTRAFVSDTGANMTTPMDSKQETLASLHGIAMERFSDSLGSARNPTGVNVDTLPSTAAILFRMESVQAPADSVFKASFLDVYSVLLTAQVIGPRQALNLAKDILKVRMETGDFTVFSNDRNSSNSQAALGISVAELEAGANYCKMGPEQLRNHAMALAAQGTGLWSAEEGVPAPTAARFANFIEDMAIRIVAVNRHGGPDVQNDSNEAQLANGNDELSTNEVSQGVAQPTERPARRR